MISQEVMDVVTTVHPNTASLETPHFRILFTLITVCMTTMFLQTLLSLHFIQSNVIQMKISLKELFQCQIQKQNNLCSDCSDAICVLCSMLLYFHSYTIFLVMFSTSDKNLYMEIRESFFRYACFSVCVNSRAFKTMLHALSY